MPPATGKPLLRVVESEVMAVDSPTVPHVFPNGAVELLPVASVAVQEPAGSTIWNLALTLSA